MKLKSQITYLIFPFFISTIGWAYFFYFNWKLAVAILLILWAENIKNNLK